MEDEFIFRRKFLSLLSIVTIGSIFLNIYLRSDNLSYKEKNKELILQNDSLILVNLKLIKDTNNTQQDPFPRQTVRTDTKGHE